MAWGVVGVGLIVPLAAKTFAAPADEAVPLISRDILFGNPDRSNVRLSPDGQTLAWISPSEGVLNIWVAPALSPQKARVVTNDRKRGIRTFDWAYTSQHLIYQQDEGGDENFQLFSVDLTNDKTINLTPIKGVAAKIEKGSPKFPTEILIGINDRNPMFHDIYRCDVTTGKRELVQQNTGFAGLMADDDYNIRFGIKFDLRDGGVKVQKKNDKGEWVDFESIPMEDTLTTQPLDFTPDGKQAYMLDSRGRDTAALILFDVNTKEKKLIAADDRADISDVLAHPTTKVVEATAANYDRVTWTFLDPKIKEDFDVLSKLGNGEIKIGSRSQDDKRWVIGLLVDDGPTRYYLYDRPTKKATFLFTNRSDLEKVSLVPMKPVIIPARDGMNLVSYLTLPAGVSDKPAKPLPMVLYVHGGPWARDDWGLNPVHQWLANRGYAVLSVNFRGSQGLGKKFLNAGNREWGAKMHDDLLDAVQWAIDQKIADRERVAIMGGSYGGYATLAGLTMTPDVFACGVDTVGPSNLVTLLKSVPAYWMPQIRVFKDRVGDHTTEEGRKFLESRSPLSYVDNIKKPLLIGQGKNDPRVKQAESDQIVSAMKGKKIPVTYVLYPDEGHGFQQPANRLSFFAIAEAFLARHLGGRFEPIGDDFKGSSVSVPEGVDQIPGIAEPLAGIK
ncbi:S9 family peptidase [bacterium]|nr:S9 family peptidase [bacterium]